ncbi:acyltransferase family protein [Rahnella variigena]|uniref:acyltransferase family protein n=1 Tax=Rahnella variigena TaxID=574964 RepID=UPI001330FEB9|nr:acyltransferase [Rahnella variigena]
MKDRYNCFNTLRLVAAFSVLFSHNFALSGQREPTVNGWETIGFLSVVVFFSISGFLMPASFEGSHNFMDFLTKRLRRIMPGLVVCSFVMLFIITPVFSSTSVFSAQSLYNSIYLFIQHCTFIFNDPRGVFSDFIIPHALNGSLWTLPIELSCYLVIGSALSINKSFKSVLLILVMCFVISISMKMQNYNFVFFGVPIYYLSMFGISFFTASLLSMTKQSWVKYKKLLSIISLLILFSSQNNLELNSVGIMAASCLVVSFATSFRFALLDKIDISYGVYIYAFPIQQIVINKVTNNFFYSLMISCFLTAVIAYISFIYVEKPFLDRYKSAGRKNNLPAEISTQ